MTYFEGAAGVADDHVLECGCNLEAASVGDLADRLEAEDRWHELYDVYERVSTDYPACDDAAEIPIAVLLPYGGLADDPLSDLGAKAWRRYRGPLGGSGWQNVNTGAVVYSESPPGDRAESDYPDSLEGRALESARDDPDATIEAVSSLTGIDPAKAKKVADESPGVGAEAVLRSAVASLAEDGDGDSARRLMEDAIDAAGAGDTPMFEAPDDWVPDDEMLDRMIHGAGYKADWTQEEGPRGGTRWVNASGDVTYREPSDADGGNDDPVGALGEHVAGATNWGDVPYETGDDKDVEQMRITEFEDGSTAVTVDYSDEPERGRAAKEAADLMRELGSPAAVHRWNPGSDTLDVEELEGDQLGELVRSGDSDAVDESSLLDAFAASYIAGNADPSLSNFIVDEDGRVRAFDLDNAGFEPEDVEFMYEDRVDRAFDRLGSDLRLDNVYDRAAKMQNDASPPRNAVKKLGGKDEGVVSKLSGWLGDRLGLGLKADWTRETGPEGATRWVNESGDVRYRKPAGAEPTDDRDPTDAAQLKKGDVLDLGGSRVTVIAEGSAAVDAQRPNGTTIRLSSSELSRKGAELTDDAGDLPARESRTMVGQGDDRFPVMTDASQNAVSTRVAEEVSPEASAEASRLAEKWKTSSYSDDAQTRESAFVKALNIDADVRNTELDGEEPSAEDVEAARILAEESQEFMRREYGEEFQLHRGVGDGAFIDALVSGLAGRDLDPDMNAMDNFSVSRGVADHHSDGGIISIDATPEDVVVATDALTRTGWSFEGEVSVRTDDLDLDLNDVMMTEDASVADVLEDPVGSLGDGSTNLFDLVDELVTVAANNDEAMAGAMDVFEKIRDDSDEEIIVKRMEALTEDR